ncbi:hypothetical protein [Fervidobacterium sp.]
MGKINKEEKKSREDIAKLIKDEFSYRPGPLMEEKIIRKIKRRKIRSFLYKVGIVFILSVFVILFETESINFNITSLEKTFSLKFTTKNTSFVLFDSHSQEDSELIENSRNGELDPLFRMLKYASIASDGGW